jgi:D-lyxose ketol-isomerase
MFSLNKWNQREVYSGILMIDFHVTWQIMDYPLKLMEIYSRTLGLFMAHHLI